MEPFIRGNDPDDTRDEPLGTRLRGRFEDIDVDSVEVREMRGPE
ncbi:hypothetical protein [Halolamina sp. CBA1230]|nr:hypothetical protein [Halolamina sp. CBA1230]